jgi:hypothetical protein
VKLGGMLGGVSSGGGSAIAGALAYAAKIAATDKRLQMFKVVSLAPRVAGPPLLFVAMCAVR